MPAFDGQVVAEHHPGCETCPADCGACGEAGYECIVDSCDTGLCTFFPACDAALQCMGACGDTNCAETCVANAPDLAQGTLKEALVCADAAGCY